MKKRLFLSVYVDDIKLAGKCQIQLCIPATHDTFQFGVIVPALYDEYTVLVKSGNVVSKHVNGW